MAKDLVIVESPTKARTIGRILGDAYVVRASMGHVRDLPTLSLKRGDIGVRTNGGFRPEYVIPFDKRDIIKELKALAENASLIYLATDPDREGEAISWHLVQAMGLNIEQTRRVVSHEITPEGIIAAFQSPREIDMDLVNAQQARRVLDRLVGFTLSPLIAKKLLYRGLSAGRVQSAALRMVVEREREIQAFVPEESWSIEAHLDSVGDGKDMPFKAELRSLKGDRSRIVLHREQPAQQLLHDLEGASYNVDVVIRRQARQRPAAPFITSTLQQEAGTRLRFTASRTMQVAQQLYEGVALGGGESVGLITYMRTDSTNVARSAQQEARDYLRKNFGPEYVPAQPRVYRTRVKAAQEAHEAIHPTSVLREPAAMAALLTPEQRRLYELIWLRFLASQMADAVGDRTRVEINARSVRSDTTYLFRATGLVWSFPGFRRLYQIEPDDAGQEGSGSVLPLLAEGEDLHCLGLTPHQHFTQPPPHYSEASLIRAMEEKGIGRPSTYANIVSTIQQRGYVKREGGGLRTLLRGPVVNDFLTEHFPRVVDLDFTAKMEEELDEIARGERDWQEVLQAFHEPFARDLKEAEERIPRRGIEVGEICEDCGRPMILKRSKWGKDFLSCSGFPECRNAQPIQEKVGVSCPQCEEGDLLERHAMRGKRRSTFYGCSRYPECDFSVNRRPLTEACPDCGGMLLQRGRRQAKCVACEYLGPVPEKDPVLVEA